MSEEDKAIENRFEEVFGRKPGAFPEGTTLEEKVGMIKKGREAVETAQSTELKNKMENVANLNKELEARKEKLAEEARANLERLDEGLKRDGISIEPKEKPKEPAQEQTAETSIQTGDKELNDAKGLQEEIKPQEPAQEPTAETSIQTDDEDAIKPQEPMQEQTAETSIQTDDQELNDAKGLQEDAKKPEEPVQERTPEAKKIYPILDKGEELNQDQAKSGQFDKQHGPKAEEKQPNAPLREHQKQPQQQENTQESQEKASIWNRFTHFVKKVLEQLIGEEEHVEYIKNEKETPQKNHADNNKAQGKEDRVKHVKNEQEIPQKNPAVEREAQEKGMNQISSIEINGKKFDLEPGKNFSYVTNDKTLSINITYTNQPQPEVAQQNNFSQPKVAQQNNFSQPKVAQQNNLSQPKVAQQNNFSQPKVTQQNNLSSASMNLNINGKGYNIPPGESFSYKSNNVEVSVTHGNQRDGHQRKRIDDKILSEAQTLGGNLREHGAQMKERANNDFGHTTNTPDMQKSTGGHSR